jgi:hypothetical protein
MPKRTWTAVVGERSHEVEVDWSRWTNSGHLAVDGHVVDAWGPSLFGPTKHFEIESQPAILQPTFSGFDLFVGGKKVRRR